MLNKISRMPTNPLFLVVHVINVLIALIVSMVQTGRIIREVKKYNAPAISILGGGLLAAVFGTLLILSKIKKGLRELSYIKSHLR